MKYDVFISYSRKDYVDEHKQPIPSNVISKIRELFDANNISYWFDEQCVYSGDAFAPMIARNIKSAKIFLFISTENSNVAEWTSNEIATAHTYKKKIIPFRCDDSPYNDSVIMYIAKLDYIDYNVNPSKALSRLLTSVQNYLQTEIDREEHERMESERRRQAEIYEKEKDKIVQELKETLEQLERRKSEITRELLEQEKQLVGIKGELSIVDANIEKVNKQLAELLNVGKPPLITPSIDPKKLTPSDWLLIALGTFIPSVGIVFVPIALLINGIYRLRGKKAPIKSKLILYTFIGCITFFIIIILLAYNNNQ